MHQPFFKIYKRWVLVVIAGTIIACLIVYALITDYDNKKKNYLSAEMESFSAKIRTTLRMYENFSEYIFLRIVNLPEVLDLMGEANQGDHEDKNRIRRILHQKLEKDYELIQRYDFRQLHFHLANGDSFLRFHSPANFGDNLMDVRDTIRIANTEKRYVFGFEEGRIFNGYRFVYPLSNGDRHIGSVEVSISMGSLITVMNVLYPNIDLTFVIDQNVVRETVFTNQQTNYISADFFPGYMMDREIVNAQKGFKATGDRDLKYVLIADMAASNQTPIRDRQSFNRIVEHDGKRFLVHYLSIPNVSGVPVAYLIASTRIEPNMLGSEHLYRDLLLVALLFLLLFGSTFVYAKKQEQLHTLASTDKLTGLYNRHKFIELAKRELIRQKRYESDLSVMILDIDYFKRINDTYGHNTGDQVLRQMGGILLNSMRQQDVTARWGGEEFVVLLPQTSPAAAAEAAERLRVEIQSHHFAADLNITASFGVAAVTPNTVMGLDELIHGADQKLYASKETGRNKVTF